MQNKQQELKTIGIVGCGQMGKAIACSICIQDFKVILFDSNKNVLNNCTKDIAFFFEKQRLAGKIDANQCLDAINRLEISEGFEKAIKCDLIIEAVIEDFDAKIDIFQKIRSINENCFIASNTSSFSIEKMAKASGIKENLIGIHFMNPAYKMPLVELISTDFTSKTLEKLSIDFLTKINKTVVKCKDSPGFLVNRLLIPMINQAIIILEKNIADKKDIDTAMKLGANFPMGPLELADFIGLDTVLAIINVLHQEDPNISIEPSKILISMVKANKLGRKTKEGFYNYD